MIDYQELAPMLDGLWGEILAMYGIDVGDIKGLNTKNTSCPLCGGHDRAHWREQGGRLALYCRNCAADSMKSPEDVIMESTGIDFHQLVKDLANFVNHVPLENIHKAKIAAASKPKSNMPIDHKQDHELVERFIAQCEWCHSMNLLGLHAPNPQKLPQKNNIDYYPIYNQSGVMVNLAKYNEKYDGLEFIAGGQSYGCLYKIEGKTKRSIIVVDPIDGILCWYKTKATIYIAFTVENLRCSLYYRKDICPVVCVRTQDEYDEHKENGHSVRLVTGDSFKGFEIKK